MKRISTFLTLCLISLSTLALHTSKEDFSFDEAEFYSSFSCLVEINEVLEQDPGLTMEDLSTSSKISPQAIEALATISVRSDDPLGIPAFFWGCVLGWVGVFLTYIFTDQDKEQAKKALKGCMTQAACIVGCYVGYILFFLFLAGSSGW